MKIFLIIIALVILFFAAMFIWAYFAFRNADWPDIDEWNEEKRHVEGNIE